MYLYFNKQKLLGYPNLTKGILRGIEGQYLNLKSLCKIFSFDNTQYLMPWKPEAMVKY